MKTLAPLLLALAACQAQPAAPVFEAPAADLGAQARLQDEPSGPMAQIDIRIVELPEGDLSGTDFETITEPRLLVYDRQRAEIIVSNELAYVSRFDLETAPDGASAIADPVVDVFRDGVLIEVRPQYLGNGRWSGSLSFRETKLKQMHELRRALVPGTAPVTIQIPESETFGRSLFLAPNAENRWDFDLGRTASGRRLGLSVAITEIVIGD